MHERVHGCALSYVGHDFPPAEHELRFACSVQAQRQHKLHVRNGISEEAFVCRRQGLHAASRSLFGSLHPPRPAPALNTTRASSRRCRTSVACSARAALEHHALPRTMNPDPTPP